MTVRETRAIAANWVREKETVLPGFVGAYLGGSTAALPPDSEISGGSDMDVYVVLRGDAPDKRGKFETEGALLEVSYVREDALFPAEKALRDYHLANSLRHRAVLCDPEGRLTALTEEIAAKFAQKEWIAARRDHALSRVKGGLTGLNRDAALPDRTVAWLFSTGISCHAVLVSALENPTVRLRYLRTRETLEAWDRLDLYEKMLKLSGFADVTPEQASDMLNCAERAFDRAIGKGRTWFFFQSDISEASRPAAIGSAREMIARGLHRETVFWTITTFARSMKMLLTDAPEDYDALLPSFERCLTLVNRETWEKIQTAAEKTLAFLPELTAETDRLIDFTLSRL